jgi:hypothetical protein
MISVHATKVYRGVKVQFHSLLTPAIDGVLLKMADLLSSVKPPVISIKKAGWNS